MHEVSLERAAERDLKKLSTKDFRGIISHLKLLARTPRPSGCRKITDSKSDWRVRVGELAKLKVEDIDFRERFIHIPAENTKTNAASILP